MNNTMKKLLIGAAALALGTAAAAVWAVAPGKAREEQKAPFKKQNLAHRGLYNDEKGIPENSRAAFQAAADAGYGVELDTRLTADGKVVISHDDDLFRMTGEHVRVSKSSYAALQQLRLKGTEETVPLFEDVLTLLTKAGVPVVVEVKPVAKRDALCRATLDIMDRHDHGKLCVESFDPLTVFWFRRNAPDIFRGQLTSQADDLKPLPAPLRWIESRVLLNFLGRPQFIAHHTGEKSVGVLLCERMGAFRVRWTAHDRGWEEGSDAVIFEKFLPPVNF